MEAGQGRKPRPFDMFARVFMRFADIDEDGAPFIEALLQRHRID
jgi:hypothetical protein